VGPTVVSNFSFLAPHDVQLVRLGALAERYSPDDPNTCLLKLRQLAELLVQLTATRVGTYISSDEKQFELLQADTRVISERAHPVRAARVAAFSSSS
jgi:hypothetical protein